MGMLIGMAGIAAPAFLAIGLTVWSWRFVGHRALQVIIALSVGYGLQSLAAAPVAAYFFRRNAPATVEAAQLNAGCILVVSAMAAILIGLPLLRALALVLRKERTGP
jgi:hypothetical protein